LPRLRFFAANSTMVVEKFGARCKRTPRVCA
jgi:hypothetical protein